MRLRVHDNVESLSSGNFPCRPADPPGDPPLAPHPDVVPVGALLQEEMHRGTETPNSLRQSVGKILIVVQRPSERLVLGCVIACPVCIWQRGRVHAT